MTERGLGVVEHQVPRNADYSASLAVPRAVFMQVSPLGVT